MSEEDDEGEEENQGGTFYDPHGFKLRITHADFRVYWWNRYELFSKFDDGIRLDAEGLYSVTPEEIGAEIAGRCRGKLVLDAFCGVGGNAIQFAVYGSTVLAVDVDSDKLLCTQHNAAIYSVDAYIDCIQADFFELSHDRLSKFVDVVFLSPPWGGPRYKKRKSLGLSDLPVDGFAVFEAAARISRNIAYFLPRNIDLDDVARLGICEMKFASIKGRVKGFLFYFGSLIR